MLEHGLRRRRQRGHRMRREQPRLAQRLGRLRIAVEAVNEQSHRIIGGIGQFVGRRQPGAHHQLHQAMQRDRPRAVRQLAGADQRAVLQRRHGLAQFHAREAARVTHQLQRHRVGCEKRQQAHQPLGFRHGDDTARRVADDGPVQRDVEGAVDAVGVLPRAFAAFGLLMQKAGQRLAILIEAGVAAAAV